MTILLYVVIVLLWLILDQQEKSHATELAREYRRLGKMQPTPRPKLPMLESCLNILVGAFLLFGFGPLFLWTNFSMLRMSTANPALLPQEESWNFTAVIIATGAALLFLGIRSVRENRRYARRVGLEKIASDV